MEIVNETVLYSYYNDEVNRFLNSDRHSDNLQDAFKTVCQSLYWACLLLDFLRKNNNYYYKILDKHDSKGEIEGIIYARNRVTHQYPLLLKITDGAKFPIVFPNPFFEIEWKSIEDLPLPDKGRDDKVKRNSYKENLAGKPVRHTFGRIWYFFDDILNKSL